MRIRPSSQRGIAIFIVMVSIFVLTVLAAGFAISMKVETRLALNANNECQMEWLGRSQIEFAKEVLGRTLEIPNDGQRYDALNQGWCDISKETNDAIIDMCSPMEIAPGVIIRKPDITDAERKININLVLTDPALLERALILIGADASQVPTIIASVQDWIDRDENKHLSGAESEYYSHLDPPYNSKNGPIDDLTELMLIKGITPEMFWGPNSTNHPGTVIQTKQNPGFATGRAANAAPTVNAGLVDIFTPCSGGVVNINTASATVLQVLGFDQETANRIVEYRDSTQPFNNIGELINVIPNQAVLQQMMRYLAVRSYTFEVTADVQIDQFKRRYTALLRRNSARDIQVMNFRWEE
jgi:general secretion pathway protein K